MGGGAGGGVSAPASGKNEFDPLKGHGGCCPPKAANKSSEWRAGEVWGGVGGVRGLVGGGEPRAPFIAANDLFIKSDDG